jgi:hypothetical protein
MFGEAFLALAFAHLMVRFLSLRRMAPLLGRHMTETTTENDLASMAILRRVALAIAILSSHVPWRCLCLEQAVAAKLMLRWRGIASTLYVGASTRPGAFAAHAWLRCGTTIIIGAAGREDYSVLATFADG